MQLEDCENMKKGLVLKSPGDTSLTALTREYLGILSAADNPAPSRRSHGFLSVNSNNSNHVRVEFGAICQRLRLELLESVARDRHGDDAVRIIRILLDVGKMDEKHVSRTIMFFNQQSGD